MLAEYDVLISLISLPAIATPFARKMYSVAEPPTPATSYIIFFVLGRTQTETITVRVTPEEKYAIQERMYEAVAPSMRQFVMDMCLNGEIVVNSDLRELNSELRYQGNNLNQLTRLAHQGRATVIDLAELLTVYRKILLVLGGNNNGNR